MTFDEVKKKVAEYYFSDTYRDPEEFEGFAEELANVKDYQDLINMFDGCGCSPYEAGEFIFYAITS